jgi:hypothetical protein
MCQDEKITKLQEQNKRLEDRCNNAFDQITELRTIIQEIYGANAKSERFICHEILRISGRLDELAKQVRPGDTTITVSPSITQNPSSNSTSSANAPLKEEEKKRTILGFEIENMMTAVIALIVGGTMLLGLAAMIILKLYSFYSGILN